MTDRTIDLDHHRGMAAQKATELRRLLADVTANETALRLRQEELETHLVAAPAANWHEAAEKARYLLNLFAGTLPQGDRRRQRPCFTISIGLPTKRSRKTRLGASWPHWLNLGK